MDGVTTVTDRGVPPDVERLRAAAADVLKYLPVLLGTKEGDITAAFGAVGRLAELVEQQPTDAPIPESELRLMDGNR